MPDSRTREFPAVALGALRLADVVTFHYHNRQSYIRASVTEPDTPVGFTARKRRIFTEASTVPGDPTLSLTIPCAVTVQGFTDCGRGRWHLHQQPDTVCQASLNDPHTNPLWRTAVTLLRPYDRLTLKWIANTDSELARDTGWRLDELRLLTSRGAGTTYHFPITHRTAREDASRMIRRPA